MPKMNLDMGKHISEGMKKKKRRRTYQKADIERLICSSLNILIGVEGLITILEVASILHLLTATILSLSFSLNILGGFSLDTLLLGRTSGSTLLGDLRRGDIGTADDSLFLLGTGCARCLGLLFRSRCGWLGAIIVEAELLLDLTEADLGGVGIVVTGLGGDDLPVYL